MEKRYIDELTKLAKNLDEKSQFKEADEITSLIVKIAQLDLPTPQKPVEEKGFFQNIGDATGQGLKNIFKGVGSAASSAWGAASSAAGVVTKPFKDISRTHKMINEMPAYEAKIKKTYEIQSASNKILTRTYNESIANEFTPEEARQKARRLTALETSQNPALDTNCQVIYKVPFSEFVDGEFGVYVESKIPLFYPPK